MIKSPRFFEWGCKSKENRVKNPILVRVFAHKKGYFRAKLFDLALYPEFFGKKLF